jgi:hypothetical protein
MDDVSDRKTPVDQALDLLVYAPLGFALDARTLLPKLVERGRNQVSLAKMMGQFAVTKGQAKAGQGLSRVQEQAMTALAELGLLGAADGAGGAGGAGDAVPAPTAVRAPAPAADRPRRAASAAPTGTAASEDLAIPDFDSLAASQVIPRLEGLSADELEAVRAYEAGRRGRKTILNKIAQLQA